jgi:hypothetical protein
MDERERSHRPILQPITFAADQASPWRAGYHRWRCK